MWIFLNVQLPENVKLFWNKLQNQVCKKESLTQGPLTIFYKSLITSQFAQLKTRLSFLPNSCFQGKKLSFTQCSAKFSLFTMKSGEIQQEFAWERLHFFRLYNKWLTVLSFIQKKQCEPISHEHKTQIVPKQPTKIISEWKTELVIWGLVSIIFPLKAEKSPHWWCCYQT